VERGENVRLVAAMDEPGAVVTEIACEAEVNASLLYRWRRDLGRRTPRFVPVRVAPDASDEDRASAPACTPPSPPSSVAMIAFPSGARVWLATGHTDMRKGFGSLALMAQEGFKRVPTPGDLWIFRGRRGDLIKLIWHDGDGACLYANYLTSYCTPFR
jgi:transposase